MLFLGNFIYLSLPKYRDVTTIFWEYSTHNSVISVSTFMPGTTFIKIKESSSSAPHNSVISATASLWIRESFWFSHKSVKITLLNAWLCTRKNKSFRVWDKYKLLWKRLLRGVLSIRFNSIEEKSWFLDTLSWKFRTINLRLFFHQTNKGFYLQSLMPNVVFML